MQQMTFIGTFTTVMSLKQTMTTETDTVKDHFAFMIAFDVLSIVTIWASLAYAKKWGQPSVSFIIAAVAATVQCGWFISLLHRRKSGIEEAQIEVAANQMP